MAVTVRNVAVASTGTAQGTGSPGVTISVPSGTQNGDVLYLAVMAASSTGTFDTPSGWTVVEAQFASTGQASAKMALYRRVASSEPASYTFTWQTGAATGRVALLMIGFVGVNATTPQQAKAKDAGAGPTSTEVLPSVTPTTATMIAGFYGAYTPSFGATTWTAAGTMTEQADTSSSNTGASNASVSVATESVSAGATGTRTATGSRSDLRPCGVMVALNPINVVERSAAIDASATVVVANRTFFSIESRAAAVDAAATVVVSNRTFFSIESRSAALDAAGLVSTSATFLSILARSAALDAVGSISVTPTPATSRAAFLSAVASVSVAGAAVPELERAAAFDAVASIAVAGVVTPPFERAAALDAVATVTVVGVVEERFVFTFPIGRAPVLASAGVARLGVEASPGLELGSSSVPVLASAGGGRILSADDPRLEVT